MKKYDVVALGELLIDFTSNGVSEQGNPLMEANPGGAPCNLLAMLCKLGKKTAFIGKVGDDVFGKQLRDALQEVGIDSSNLLMDKEVRTTLAIVHTAPNGDRDFSFYRNPGADMMLRKEEIDTKLIEESRFFHFGTLSSTHPEVREATRYAIDVAKEKGLLISFDPNLREPLWNNLEDAKREIAYGLGKCDILKISDNEAEFMTGLKDYKLAARLLMEQYPNIRLLFLTLGREGSMACCNGKIVFAKPFIQEQTIETTGAGDTFGGCALNYLLEHDLDNLTEEQLKELLCFANAGASIITTKKGALKVMPEKEAILKLIEEKR